MKKKINQWACYNRIWSWSPMPCEKHGPRASVTTKTSAFGLGFCLLSPSGHVFHTAWETMIKSYNTKPCISTNTHKNMSPDDGTVATPHERPPLLRGHFHTTFRVAAGEGFYCIWVRAYIDFQWPHFLNGCLVAILDFSVSGWHGFSSVTQICFGISVSNFMCMSLVAVGRSLTIVSYVLLSTHCPLPPSPMGRGYPSRSLIYNF